MKEVSLSVVIPVFNEAGNLEPLYRETVAVLSPSFPAFELIFVNDGSSDGSLAELLALNKVDPRVKIINFRRNFGQSAAISAGFDLCCGEVVITMDADMQNDPADIPGIVEKVNEGYDIVNGWRKNRRDKFLTRKIPSFLGNLLVSFITKVKLHDYGCTLRGFRREVVKNLKLYGEMHRYIPAIASRIGIRSIEIPVNHRPRRHGKSKYGLGRTYRVLLDLISIKYLLSYYHRPLQVFGGIGALMMFIGFLFELKMVYDKFVLLQPLAGRPLLFLTLLMIFLGVQVISLGLIAEMLSKIYHEGLNKNVYSIRGLIGFSDEKNPDDRSGTIF